MSSRPVSSQAGRGGAVRRGAAAAALLLVVLGFPVLLAVAVGWPLPRSVPRWQQLQDAATSALQAGTVVKVLACGAWLAWVHFTVCVLVEVRAELTGRALHVPFGGINRQLAHRLVATVLLAGAVSSTVGLTAAHALAVPAASSAPTSGGLSANFASADGPVATPGSERLDRTGGSGPAAVGAAASTSAAAGPMYVVQPPHRGRIDNLWDISERHLGSGLRWREIYALNQGRTQQVGGSLSDPDVVRVGWRLLMPADAVGVPEQPPAAGPAPELAAERSHVVRAGESLSSIARDQLGSATREAELFAANRERVQSDGRRLEDADMLQPGWVLLLPTAAPGAGTPSTPAPSGGSPSTGGSSSTGSSTPVPAPAAPAPPTAAPAAPAAPTPSSAAPTTPAPSAPATSPASPAAPAASAPAASAPAASVPGDAVDSADSDDAVWVRTAEGIGGLLAAFLLVLLARRRMIQERPRKPGQRVPLPTGSAETTELELRAVEDPIAIAEVDLALRRLAASQLQAGRPLPEVRAARVTASTVELYLVELAEAPAPWTTSEATAAMWTLHREDLRGSTPDERDGQLPAPYPALVTVGQDDEAGHVLVDLEQICALGVTGAAETSRAVLSAIALELASSTWAQEVDLTLVGLCPELPDALADRAGQLRHIGSLEQLIGELEQRADVVGAGLRDAGLDSPRAARGRGRAPDAWAPEVVLLAEAVPDVLRERLDRVLQRLPRVGVAAVTGAGAPLGEWALQVRADGRAVLQPAGLTVTVQQIPADKYHDVLRQLAVSVAPAVAGPAWAAGLPDRELRVADLPERALVDEHEPLEPPTDDHLDQPQATPGDTTTTDESPTARGSVRVAAATADTAGQSPAGDVDEQPAVTHRADALVLDARTQGSAGPAQLDGSRDRELAPSSGSVVDKLPAAPQVAPVVVDLRQQPAAAYGPATLPAAAGPAATVGSSAVKVVEGASADQHEHEAGPDGQAAGDDAAGDDAVAADQAVLLDEAAAAGGDAGAAPAEPSGVGSGLVVLSGDREQLSVPRVRLLGDVAVLGARGPEPVTRKDGKVTGNVTYRATAMIVYLALNPGAVLWDVMSERLSPGKRWTTKTVGTVTLAARKWLGGDEDGPFFPPFAGSGDYRLRADVRTDWHEWLDLVGADVTSTPTAQLDEALGLVQGAPFSNLKKTPDYYAWAEPIRLEMVSSIVDVSHEVVRRVLLSRDQPGGDLPATSRARAALARRAVRVGRIVDAGSELMFRDALLVEHRTGNTAAMRQLAQQVVQHAEDLDSDLEPETEQLLSDLKVLAR